MTAYKIFKSLCIFFIILLFCAFNASGDFSQITEYETVARNFLAFLKSDKAIVSTKIIRSNSVDPTLPEIDIAFLAELSGGGYIFVSTSKQLTPIKAYSLTGDFDTLPDAYKQYLYTENELRIRNLVTYSRSAMDLSETEKRWEFLLNLGPSDTKSSLEYTPGSYLLATQWNQGTPYNKFLPEVNGPKVVSGCVNIALAQLMKYHGYPDMGSSVSAYNWNEETLKAIYNRPYHWGNMPDSLGLNEEEYKIDEVALLIRDIGIMNETKFKIDSSSTSTHFTSLAKHFGYSKNVAKVDNGDETLIFNTIQSEIDAMRPVLASLRYHMTVADGYGSDATGDKIHLNMGWGGHYDDYYYMGQTIVAGGYTFPPPISIYYNIKPCSGDDCLTNLEALDQISGLNISGRFDDERDVDWYQVILKGQTIITGLRGGSNRAFYISLYDADHLLIQRDSFPLDLDLSPGIYYLQVSLRLPSFWVGQSYDEDNRDYTVDISTQPLSESETITINQSLDSPPVMFNSFHDRWIDSTDISTIRMLIDARDENDDVLSLDLTNTNPAAIGASLEDNNILRLDPIQGVSHVATKIILQASANGKTAEKSFVIMVLDEPVGFGTSFSVSGLFESQFDYNTHELILDGSCTISGYNGYANQAFYTSVLDKNSNVVFSPNNQTISGTFTQDIYYLGASLKQNPGGGGLYYTYDPGVNDQYRLDISCPQADEQTETIANILSIDLSGTQGPPVPVPGDLNGDDEVNLTDAIIGIQVISGINPTGLRADYASSGADVNGDNQVGAAEVIFILEKLIGYRN